MSRVITMITIHGRVSDVTECVLWRMFTGFVGGPLNTLPVQDLQALPLRPVTPRNSTLYIHCFSALVCVASL